MRAIMDGYIKFNMSYNDMLIVNTAIMYNIKMNGNFIEIVGKPVYELYSEFPEDVKKNVLKLVRLAYSRETFNIIDRIWEELDKDRAMINYPEWYWANEVSGVEKEIVRKEAEKSVSALELAEQELYLKRLSNSQREISAILLQSGIDSIWIAYKKLGILNHEEVEKVREYVKIKNSRELTELQLAMCGILHFNLQDKPFSEVIKMVEA